VDALHEVSREPAVVSLRKGVTSPATVPAASLAKSDSVPAVVLVRFCCASSARFVQTYRAMKHVSVRGL
jgi:hypothetical protein